jgi:hypothetical protein
MTCNQYHWIDNNLRSSQKFQSGQTETYSIFGGFYKLQVRGKRIKQISFKKNWNRPDLSGRRRPAPGQPSWRGRVWEPAVQTSWWVGPAGQPLGRAEPVSSALGRPIKFRSTAPGRLLPAATGKGSRNPSWVGRTQRPTWGPSPAMATGQGDAAEDGDLDEVRNDWLGPQDEDLRDGSGGARSGLAENSTPASLGQGEG